MPVLAQTELLDPADSGHGSAQGMTAQARYPASSMLGTEQYFRESLGSRLRRYVLGVAYAIRPARLHNMPQVLRLTVEYLVRRSAAESRFASPVPIGPEGLIGVSAELSPAILLDRYRRGMFPFCHLGPMKWWSPAVRPVLHPQEARIEKNLRRVIRQGKYRVTFDTAFADVMRACAKPRAGKTPLTWITPKIMRAFWQLHLTGHAHSVEVWNLEGQLVGGLYGLAMGGIFFGESQFSVVRDASKVAVATLHCHLAHWGFSLRDAKWQTDHLASLGFRLMGRGEFLATLAAHASQPGKVGRWSVDEALDVSAWQPNRAQPEGSHRSA